MPNAQQSFVFLWKRVVAALSLVAAALIASMAASPAGGAGVVGSRTGHAGHVASAPSPLIASLDEVLDGGQQAFPAQELSGAKGKAAGVVAPWPALPLRRSIAPSPSPEADELPRHHAARSGLTRAPPLA